MFIIDPDKKLRLSMTYPMSVGRNFDEILRAIDALQSDGYVGPAPVTLEQYDRRVTDWEIARGFERS